MKFVKLFCHFLYIYDGSSNRFSFHHVIENRIHTIQRDFLPDNFIQVRGLPFIGQPVPKHFTGIDWTVGRTNTQEADAPENQWENRGIQSMAASHAAARNITPQINGPADAGKHVTTNIVNAAGPDCLFQWSLAPVKVMTGDTLGGAEMFQPVKFSHLPGDGVHLVTGMG